MFWVDYLKQQLKEVAVVALGERTHNAMELYVNVRTRGSYMLLDVSYDEVIYQLGNAKRVQVVMKVMNSERNVGRVMEAGLKPGILKKVYRFSGNAQHGHNYHMLRFAGQLG